MAGFLVELTDRGADVLEVKEVVAGQLLFHVRHQGQDLVVGGEQGLEMGVFFRQFRLGFTRRGLGETLPGAFQGGHHRSPLSNSTI